MNILVLNSGSSSLKYQLINVTKEITLAKGICENIGKEQSLIKQTNINGLKLEKELTNISDHTEAFKHVENALMDEKYGVIKKLNEVSAVGHRVVHGGEYFKKPAVITEEVIREIRELIPLAPLHNPSHLTGILACRKLLGDTIPQVAVFDTSFYSNLPPKAYIYPIPYEYYLKHNIRKYGFHGTSHKYVSERYNNLFKKPGKQAKIISCHLGNGSSITAINDNKAIETSMGLTPLGGIMMGTRSGSLDPSVVLHLAKQESLNCDDMNNILNKKSGLFGISGISSDEREITKAEKAGNERAKLAHEMMNYQIIQYIGSYYAILQGCDAIIFTGGIGENQWEHRKKICEHLKFMGIEIDDKLNQKMILGGEGKISTSNSKIDVMVIPTNEEMEIAKETYALLNPKED